VHYVSAFVWLRALFTRWEIRLYHLQVVQRGINTVNALCKISQEMQFSLLAPEHLEQYSALTKKNIIMSNSH